jgi:hypothetical protein
VTIPAATTAAASHPNSINGTPNATTPGPPDRRGSRPVSVEE